MSSRESNKYILNDIGYKICSRRWVPVSYADEGEYGVSGIVICKIHNIIKRLFFYHCDPDDDNGEYGCPDDVCECVGCVRFVCNMCAVKSRNWRRILRDLTDSGLL